MTGRTPRAGVAPPTALVPRRVHTYGAFAQSRRIASRERLPRVRSTKWDACLKNVHRRENTLHAGDVIIGEPRRHPRRMTSMSCAALKKPCTRLMKVHARTH